MIGSYVVAVSAMLFSALSALTLFYAIRHFDPPEQQKPAEKHAAA
jgi:hypothetical protein